jgi:hypothetical protein
LTAEQARHSPVHAESQQTPSAQKPFTHWLFCVQPTPLPRRQAPAPLQTLVPVQLGESCWLSGMLAQVPTLPGRLQVWHVPLQLLLQQTPSTQLPLVHWLPCAQRIPLLRRHAPEPLHTELPPHVPGSCWKESVLVQVPTLPAMLHAWQVPLHALEQQTPSTQTPAAHWLYCPQGAPWSKRQRPAPLQTLPPAQVPLSGWRAGEKVQIPRLPGTLQAWQVPLHALLQQTPSTQLPPAHWLSAVHAALLASRQAPLPAHALVPTQPGASCWKSGVLVQVPALPGMLHAWQVPAQALLQQ